MLPKNQTPDINDKVPKWPPSATTPWRLTLKKELATRVSTNEIKCCID